MHCSVIIGGDFNLEFLNSVTQSYAFNKFISSANLHRRETTETTKHTFCCETRNPSSLIDHFLVSKCVIDKVDACYTVASGLNFSDHLPLAMHCVLPLSYSHLLSYKTAPGSKSKRYRWDKADLISYYYTFDNYLSQVNMTHIAELCCCPVGCQCDRRRYSS